MWKASQRLPWTMRDHMPSHPHCSNYTQKHRYCTEHIKIITRQRTDGRGMTAKRTHNLPSPEKKLAKG